MLRLHVIRHPNTRSEKMASLHRLSETELHNEEGSFSFTVHRPDREPFDKTKLLLLLGWIIDNMLYLHHKT